MEMRVVELQIEDVAFGGKGVGRAEGKVVFVPFTIDGERIAARITREKKHFAEAQLDQVLDASAHRAQPECPYFGRCGGCSYQHISYEHQLELKQRQVDQLLRRIGRFNDARVQQIVASPKSYGYRNRVTVHVENGVIGYYRRDVHQLIDVEVCPIAGPAVNRALAELRARHPRAGHYTLRASPGRRVFEQTNDEVADALAHFIASFLPAQQHLLVDAYCGAGFFAKKLLDRFERVVGIEWDRYAVAAAQQTATAKETYIAGDVDAILAGQLAGADFATTAVIVDPPGTGLTGATRRILLAHPVGTLIYVSCNPATLARDLADLRQRFTIKLVLPLDMFPQTAEIECAVHLVPTDSAQASILRQRSSA
jgi:23S rRNA (uracil1939-C5)-methyltransferase